MRSCPPPLELPICKVVCQCCGRSRVLSQTPCQVVAVALGSSKWCSLLVVWCSEENIVRLQLTKQNEHTSLCDVRQMARVIILVRMVWCLHADVGQKSCCAMMGEAPNLI